MPDPFPYENNKDEKLLENKLPPETMELVYDRDRYMAKQSPKPIFIPNRKIMLKIMRACIGIKDEKDLWFY